MLPCVSATSTSSEEGGTSAELASPATGRCPPVVRCRVRAPVRHLPASTGALRERMPLRCALMPPGRRNRGSKRVATKCDHRGPPRSSQNAPHHQRCSYAVSAASMTSMP